jgi:hypothetical protein
MGCETGGTSSSRTRCTRSRLSRRSPPLPAWADPVIAATPLPRTASARRWAALTALPGTCGAPVLLECRPLQSGLSLRQRGQPPRPLSALLLRATGRTSLACSAAACRPATASADGKALGASRAVVVGAGQLLVPRRCTYGAERPLSTNWSHPGTQVAPKGNSPPPVVPAP